jgi:hypothetical protein
MQVWPVAAKIPATDTVDGLIEIGVIEDNVGGLAAELQSHALDAACGLFIHALSGAIAAGKGNLCDIGMRNQRLSDFVSETP